MPKDDKKSKKPIPKNLTKVPKLPPNTSVKIIEISLQKLLIPIAGIFIIMSLYWTYGNMTGEKTQINEKIGLNEIITGYNS